MCFRLVKAPKSGDPLTLSCDEPLHTLEPPPLPKIYSTFSELDAASQEYVTYERWLMKS